MNLGATNNGDGTTSSDAASPGAAGAWNTWANAVTGIGTISVATRCNVKGNITLSGALSLNTAGTSITVPLWWRGYSVTPGDIETDNTLTKSLTTQSTNIVTVSTAYQTFSGLAFTGSTTSGAIVQATGGNIWFHRCRFAATGANSNSVALSAANNANLYVSACDLTSNALANVLSSTVGLLAVGNTVRVGLSGIVCTSFQTSLFNTIDGCSLHGINGTGTVTAVGNSIYSVGSKSSADGIRTAAAGGSLFVNNVISNFNGTSNNGINCTSTSGINSRLIANSFYNCTNNIAGILESLEFLGNGTLASDPFTSATGHDFSVGSIAKAIGFPGAFENASFVGYMDGGAVQRVEPSASGNVFGGEF